MIKGGKGGGNTTTGLHFEQRTDIKRLFEQIDGYSLGSVDIQASLKTVAAR